MSSLKDSSCVKTKTYKLKVSAEELNTFNFHLYFTHIVMYLPGNNQMLNISYEFLWFSAADMNGYTYIENLLFCCNLWLWGMQQSRRERWQMCLSPLCPVLYLCVCLSFPLLSLETQALCKMELNIGMYNHHGWADNSFQWLKVTYSNSIAIHPWDIQSHQMFKFHSIFALFSFFISICYYNHLFLH